MTQLAVVAYPILGEEDRQWIEAVRAQHDPQVSLIKAHFTLVFPAELAVEPLVAEVAKAVVDFAPIPFVLRRAAAFRGAVGEGSHVFLLPEEGNREILALHDRLYSGALRFCLLVGVPFLPHVTVGAYPILEACEEVAARLNQARRTLRGTVDGIDVIEVEPRTVRTVVSVPLRGSMECRPTTGCT